MLEPLYAPQKSCRLGSVPPPRIFFFDDFHHAGYWYGLYGRVDLSDKFLVCEPYVCLTKSEEKHFQDYF